MQQSRWQWLQKSINGLSILNSSLNRLLLPAMIQPSAIIQLMLAIYNMEMIYQIWSGCVLRMIIRQDHPIIIHLLQFPEDMYSPTIREMSRNGNGFKIL